MERMWIQTYSDNKCLYLSVCGVIHRCQCVMEYGARRRKVLEWLGCCGSQHRLQRHGVVEITARALFVSSCVTCCHPIRRVAACCWAAELKSGSHLKVTFRVNSTATSETTVTHNLHICLSHCLCCVCLRDLQPSDGGARRQSFIRRASSLILQRRHPGYRIL